VTTPQETAEVMAILAGAYPSWSAPKETVLVFHKALQDIPVTVIREAATQWILTEERPPSVAALRKKSAELQGLLAPSPAEAWAEVQEVAERYGIYQAEQRPRWSHDLIRQTVKTLGYYNICQTDNITTVRAQFNKMYEQLKAKSDQQIVVSKGFSLELGSVALLKSTVVESLGAPQGD
jgi:Loader and inhibitor of phage G40P